MSRDDIISLSPVLYAEDDENDVFFMRRAFKKAGLNNPLVVARNGSQAIDFLRSFQERTSTTRLALVILDLKMPDVTGLDVLRWARKKPNLSDLAIVLFTSSTQERDIRAAYESGANAYLVKPANPDQLTDLVREIQSRCLQQTKMSGWLNLPSNQPPPH